MISNRKMFRRSKYTPFIFFSPSLLVLTFGLFIPVIMLFGLSLNKGIPGSGLILDEFTIGNYLRIFDVYYLKIFFRTFKLAVLTTILSLFMGYPVALLIARSSGKIKTILLTIVLIPLLTNVIVRTIGLMMILGKHGPINQFLDLIGVPKIHFIPGELGIIIGLTQVFMAYMILSISSVLSNIDFSLEEAARDLGCSKFAVFWKIIFPLSMPGVISGSLFVFLLSFSSFVTPRLLGGGIIQTITMLIYQQSMMILNWPFAASVAIILLIINMVLVSTYTKSTASRLRDRTVYQNVQENHAYLKEFFKTIKEWKYNKVNDAYLLVDALLQKSSLMRTLSTLSLWFGKLFINIWKTIVLLFIFVPPLIIILSSFSASNMIIFPPTSFSVKWYTSLLERQNYLISFLISLRLAILCVLISGSFGTLASLALARYNFRGKEFLRSAFLSPLMLTGVIAGLSILRFLVAIGWAASFQGLLLAHLTLTTAYVVRSVSSCLVGFDTSLEEAARDMGASYFYTLRKVTLPLIKPGLIVASIFAFIVSFGETTISLFLTGARTITLPVRIFSLLQEGYFDSTIIAISSILIIMAFIALFIIGKVFGLEEFSIK